MFSVRKLARTVIATLAVTAAATLSATASESGDDFNPGDLIVGHVANSHEWHILTTPSGEHVSVPLPIIVYSKHSGWHCFMSSRFHHGHERYHNFELPSEGDNKGVIVEYDAAGQLLPDKPLDLSITKNVLGLFVALIITYVLIMRAVKIARESPRQAAKGILSPVEAMIVFVRDDIARSSIGEKADRFVPILLSFFFMIFVTNLTGLIPIFPFGASITGNLSVTLGLALFTFVVITLNGSKTYWKHMVNTPGVPMLMKLPVPIMPAVEIMGALIKPIVLAIRLFANMLAGHIVILAFICLIFIFAKLAVVAAVAVTPVALIFVVFISFLELLVAFIQAFVFTLLSAIFIGMAVEEHH